MSIVDPTLPLSSPGPIPKGEPTVIPPLITDHGVFRAWARSNEFPRRGRFSFLNGSLWVDLTMEQLFTHNGVKGELSTHLNRLVRLAQLGYFFFDRAFLTNLAVGLSTEPDGMFVSYATLEAGLARLVQGSQEGYVEVEGTPNMVLEIVSASSVTKDTKVLPDLYWKARIPEFWVIDARGPSIQFQIQHWTVSGYDSKLTTDGLPVSAVFNKAFQLTQTVDRRGNPLYTLADRDAVP